MNNRGLLIYKCRQCGELVKNIGVPDGLKALIHASNGWALPREWGSGKLNMHDVHRCSDDIIGITDLIGFESDNEGQ